MDVGLGEAVAAVGLAGGIATAIVTTLSLGRKVGRLERDVEGLLEDMIDMKKSAAIRELAIAKLDNKMDTLKEKFEEMHESVRDIQRQCRTIAVSGACPADPKNRGGAK